jgi:anti-anti-sigma factor
VFSVDVSPAAQTVVLRLSGELDFDSVVQLNEAAESALSKQPRLLVVDCSDLSFCDSSGTASLVGLYQQLSSTGGKLRLAAPPGSVARTFELTGLDQVIAMHGGLEEAIAAGNDTLPGEPPPGPEVSPGHERRQM